MGQPSLSRQVIEATQVVVIDEFGTPVAVWMEYAPGRYLFEDARKPDELRKLLAQIGINAPVVRLPFNSTAPQG
jgi:translation initiation factor IF-3